MGRERKVVFASMAIASIFVLSSAGGCGSREEDDEHLGKSSQALDGASGDGGCREVTLQASRAQAGEHAEDERELSPSLRFAVPSEIALSGTKNSGAHWIDLEIESVSGNEIECRYKGGANNPNDRALLFSCSHGVHAGDIVTAGEVKLEIENGSVVTARVTLSEASPCGPDASVDAAGGADAAAGGDAAADAAGPPADAATCTAASCDTHNTCSIGQCTASGCTTTPAAAGTACSDQSACTTGDVCDGLGHCAGVPVVLPPPGCIITTCDPVLGVVTTPAPDGTACSLGACTVGAACQAGACAGGTALDCSSGHACVIDACDPALGCTHTPRPAGDPAASDGNACNGLETCDGSGGSHPGTPLVCNSNSLCIVDGCTPATGCTSTPIPSCDPTPVNGSAPFEQRASLMGRLITSNGGAVTGAGFTVTNAPAEGSPANAPRGDVSASSAADGSFRARLTSFPDVEADRTPPQHVVLRVDAAGFIPAFRDAWLHAGHAVDLGVVKLVARDSAVTVIGPAGGTASDSANAVQVVIPAGALSSTINVVITPFNARDEFPSPLPDSTATMYGFELEPTGTTFSSPVTVRVANTRGAPTNIPIPTGLFDTDRGRWEHLAQATWDGTRFVFQTSHFCSFDCNLALPNKPKARPKPGPLPDPPCGDDGNVNSGSSCGLSGGSFDQRFALPTYRVKNDDFGISLTYKSGLAGARHVGTAPSDYTAVNHSSFAVAVPVMRFEMDAVPSAAAFDTITPVQPGRCIAQGPTTFGASPRAPLTFTRSIGGSTTTETFSMGLENSEAEFGGFVDLATLSPTTSPGSGLYRTHVVLSTQGGGACVGPSSTFGATDYSQAGTQTLLEDGPLATIDTFTMVNHRLTSPFGAGWAVGDVSRVYRDGDLAYLVGGTGYAERFGPRAHAKTLSTGQNGIALARDPRTGEIFGARDAGSVDRVDPVTGTATSVLSGLAFNLPVHGLAIAYVGSSREFIVALEDRLLEIDGGGGQRVLTTRTSPGLFAQANVAARDDVVFYTDVASPVLYRVRLSDPARTLETMSRAGGGDVRLYPQSQLSGVSFVDPRGLAFAGDGTLYVADRGRNAVYAVSPDGGGNVVPASHVEPVVGDGQGRYLAPLGERQPGVQLSLPEPLGLSVTEEGLLFVTTTYGLASFDPLAREAELLVAWGGADELTLNPAAIRVGLLGLTASSALSRWDQHHGDLVRLDIDRLSSTFDPTRAIAKLAGGQLELTDTTAEVVETFDSAGRLIARKKRTGETVMTVAYVDATGDAIDHITDAAGGQTVFAYSAGKIQSITDARGRTTQLSVNNLGDLVSFTEPGSELHSFVYAEHRMTEKRSPRGDLTQYSYRADGTAQTAIRPEGAATTIDASLSHPFVFNAAGKVERHGSYTDARGVVHATVINTKGAVERDTHVEDGITRIDTVTYAGDLVANDLQDVSRFDGASVQFVFDPASDRSNRLFRVAARAVNGVQTGTTQRFDAHGRLVGETRPGFEVNDAYRALFDADGWLLETHRGPTALGEHYDRDAAKHVTRSFDYFVGVGSAPTGRETTWTFRADGLPSTMTEHGVTRTITYDELPGSLNEMGWTDTVGRSMVYTRDAAGNITSTNDGVATTFASYDAHNRVIETRDALNNATTYGYTNAGCGCSQADLVTSIHTPDLAAGVDWQMTYDRDARLASVTDPHSFTESYAYETTGELKKITDKLTRDTSWTHDQLGRVTSMVDTLGRRHGNVYTVPVSGAFTGPTLMAGSGDATASTTDLTTALRTGDYQIGQNAYPAGGQPAAISLYRDATFALGFSRSFDEGRRLSARADRSAFAIDSTALPNFFTPADFWYERNSWSVVTASPVLAAKHTVSSTGANQDSSYEQDIFFDDTLANGSGFAQSLETLIRDTAGRVTTLTRRHDEGGPLLSTYAYRPDGRLAHLVNPDGTHDFTYDSRGLMESQVVSGEGTYAYGYDAMGRSSSLTYPDGHTRTQVYDDLGRMTSRCYEYSGPTTRCYTAQYDAVGNPVAMSDPDGTDTFAYDALDRLTKVTRVASGVTTVEDYAYNALGALKVNAGVVRDDQRPKLAGGGTADAAVPANVGGQPVVLDGGGRVTSLRGTTFAWNRDGTLREVDDPIPAVAETYGVDARGRRYSRMLGGVVQEYYAYEGMDRVALVGPNEGSSPGPVIESYLFDGIDHPLRIARPGASTNYYYYELDLAGNVRGLRASGGASLGGYRYSAFGQTLEDTTLITQPLRWKGRWFSPVAGGTYDVRARQWSPELGIFLSVDEFEFLKANSTLWGWPGQNPIRYRDPSGHVAIAGVAGAGEFVLGIAVSAYLAYLFYEEATKPKCTPFRMPRNPQRCASLEGAEKQICCEIESGGDLFLEQECMDQPKPDPPQPEPDPFKPGPTPEPDPFPPNPFLPKL